MAGYSSLSVDVQNLIMYQSTMLIKILLLILLIGSCYYYIQKFKASEQSVFPLAIYFKKLLNLVSYVVLWCTPLFIYLLTPTVSLDVFTQVVTLFYSILLFAFFVVTIIGMIFYGLGFFSDLLGFDNKITKKVEEYTYEKQ